jgi:hypothetical protein
MLADQERAGAFADCHRPIPVDSRDVVGRFVLPIATVVETGAFTEMVKLDYPTGLRVRATTPGGWAIGRA